MDTWEHIPTEESSKRTIQILKKSGGSKEWINTYGKPVFLKHPDIALKQFQNEAPSAEGAGLDQGFGGDFAESFDSISMTTEEIIEFLGRIEEEVML